ncbi:MAG: hypothetical protein HZA51_02105 [Planctomycetes bacterium]|nr:hypothetical protein [Planctomycetota bacterium]
MSKSREFLILEAFPDELRLATARESQGVVTVSHLSSFWCRSKSDDTSALCDQTTLDALVAYVEERGWAGKSLICLVGGPGVSCQHYDLPPLKGPALRQAALLKLKQQLHFEVTDAVVAIDAVSRAEGVTGNQQRVNATAIQKDIAQAAIALAGAARLKLMVLSAAPAACARLAADRHSDAGSCRAILSVDESSSTLVVLNGATPFVTTELPFGANDLTTALMRPIINGENVIQLDETAARALRNEIGIPAPQQDVVSLQVRGDKLLPLMEPVLQKLSKNLTQWLAFAGTCSGGGAISSVILTGAKGTINGLAPSLGSRTGIAVTSARSLDGMVSLGDGMENVEPESLGLIVAAIRWGRTLPDLIPDDTKRAVRAARIRKYITYAGPVAAVIMLSLGVVFDRTGKSLAGEIDANSQHLAAAQEILTKRTQLAADAQVTKKLMAQVESFLADSPSWTGVFKELSYRLPSQLRALDYSCRINGRKTTLVVKAGVHLQGTPHTFDDLVTQTLNSLERGGIFQRVEVSVDRSPQTEDPGADGILSIELVLTRASRLPVEAAK